VSQNFAGSPSPAQPNLHPGSDDATKERQQAAHDGESSRTTPTSWRNRTRLPIAVFVVLLVVLGFRWWRGQIPAEPASQPTIVDTNEQGTRTASLDEALRIASEGLASMEATLIDYRGRLVKRERVGNSLGAETEMDFKIRTRRQGGTAGVQPQSMGVYLAFRRPESTKGREVIWVENQNDGKLIAHDAGLAALIKLSLEPNGFLAMQGNRYPLTEIGFKNLVRQLLVRSERVKAEGGAEVSFSESYDVGGRPCLLIQVRPHATNGEVSPNTQLDFSLAEIAIDQERQIPLRYAAYGILKPGQELPDLLEEYTYYDVELNVGLTPADFDITNPEYAFP
jgi:hypothetical protein